MLDTNFERLEMDASDLLYDCPHRVSQTLWSDLALHYRWTMMHDLSK